MGELCPWADLLYGCDANWWALAGGAPEFTGIKVTLADVAAKRWGLRLVRGSGEDRLLYGEPGLIGWGGNGGFQALNLVVQFGCRRIVLVGYDMRIDKGLHWHGPHPSRLNNPGVHRMARWIAALDGAAPLLQQLGVRVVNASPISRLEAYPKMTLQEALRCFV